MKKHIMINKKLRKKTYKSIIKIAVLYMFFILFMYISMSIMTANFLNVGYAKKHSEGLAMIIFAGFAFVIILEIYFPITSLGVEYWNHTLWRQKLKNKEFYKKVDRFAQKISGLCVLCMFLINSIFFDIFGFSEKYSSVTALFLAVLLYVVLLDVYIFTRHCKKEIYNPVK